MAKTKTRKRGGKNPPEGEVDDASSADGEKSEKEPKEQAANVNGDAAEAEEEADKMSANDSSMSRCSRRWASARRPHWNLSCLKRSIPEGN